jgi:hypothetical protein
MIEKTVTYDSLFGGGKTTKTLYFHIYEEELIEWYLTEGENQLPDRMRAIVESEDWAGIIALFKRMINMAYGERVGDEFVKNPDATKAFTNTAAYNSLFMELMNNPTFATEFFNGLFPAELMAKAQAAVEAQGGPGATLTNTDLKLQPMTGATPGVGTGAPRTLIPSRVIELSGLKNPYGRDREVLPWAFRSPTGKEQTAMTKTQLQEVMHRVMSGWEAPEDI